MLDHVGFGVTDYGAPGVRAIYIEAVCHKPADAA